MHLRVEWWHPHVDAAGGVSAGSGARFFSANFPMGEKVEFVFEVPFTRARTAGTLAAPAFGDATMGNWYLGMQIGDAREPTAVIGEIGTRISATTDDAELSLDVGTLADPERLEAFLPSSQSVTAAVNALHREGALRARLRFGVTRIFSGTVTGVGDHTLLDYAALATRDIGNLRVGGAVNGRADVVGPGPFGDRVNHFVTGSAELGLGPFRPRASLRVPFERGIRRTSPWMLMLGVDFSPRGKRC